MTDDAASPFATCANDRDILNQNLLRSPDVVALGVQIYENQRSAASAYNSVLAKASPESEFTIFVHQDVYFPPGWLSRLKETIARLNTDDPSWAVLGCFGVTHTGQPVGRVYTSAGRHAGPPFGNPVRVRTLDEVVLVVRHVPGLRFTDSHPGFHMYGTDICLRAERLKLSCYVIDNVCVHNKGYVTGLPLAYYEGHCAIMKHFPEALPVKSPCALVTNTAWPLRIRLLRQRIARIRGRARVVESLPDPTTVL